MQASRKKRKNTELERHKENLARSMHRRSKYVSPLSQFNKRKRRGLKRATSKDGGITERKALEERLVELDAENEKEGSLRSADSWTPFDAVAAHKGQLYHLSRGQVFDDDDEQGQIGMGSDVAPGMTSDDTLSLDDMRVELANLIVQRRLYRRLELESLFARAIRAAEPDELNVAAVTLVVDEFREALGLSVSRKAQLEMSSHVESFNDSQQALCDRKQGSDSDGQNIDSDVLPPALRTSIDRNTLRVVSSAWDSLKTPREVGQRKGKAGQGDLSTTRSTTCGAVDVRDI